MSGSNALSFTEIGLAQPGMGEVQRKTALETPIAFEFAGLAYAVLMATPQDIEDFAIGFALSEGLIDKHDDLQGLSIAKVDQGVIVRADLPADRADTLRDRVRLRVTEGSCGLCGLQSIEEVLRPLPVLETAPKAGAKAVAKALKALPAQQSLSRDTGAVHAAAFCAQNGTILALREDVGRHNALDKLIGQCSREGLDMSEGFTLLSARCSYELVEKTVRARCPMLVTISAPTNLAVERAKASGLTLVSLARSDTALVANDPHGILI